MRATFSALRPPNQSAMSQPAQVSRLPVSGSVEPRPNTLSQTTHFAMKIANDQQAIARGAAVHQRPSSAMFC